MCTSRSLSLLGGTSGGGPGPPGTGRNIPDGQVTLNYVGPGGALTPSVAMGLMMLNKGRNPAPYVFPGNNDVASSFGYGRGSTMGPRLRPPAATRPATSSITQLRLQEA